MMGQPNADPIGGSGVAHDIMEHFNGDDRFGCVAECQALGAALWLRGDTGNLDNKYTGEGYEALANDFPDIIEHHINENMEFPDFPRVHMDSDMITKAARITEYGYSGMIDNDENTSFESYIPRCVGWMMVGYKRAIRRYRGLNNIRLYEVFRSMSSKSAEHLQNSRMGDILWVNYRPREYYANCKIRGTE